MASAFCPSRYMFAEFSTMARPVGERYRSLTDWVMVTAAPPYLRNENSCSPTSVSRWSDFAQRALAMSSTVMAWPLPSQTDPPAIGHGHRPAGFCRSRTTGRGSARQGRIRGISGRANRHQPPNSVSWTAGGHSDRNPAPRASSQSCLGTGKSKAAVLPPG